MADSSETTAVAEAPSDGAPAAGDGVSLIGILQSIGKRTDLLLAFGVVTILVVLILPLPTWLMDLGLAISITFSVLILMTALFVEK